LSGSTFIASAGITLPSALAVLRALGYRVTVNRQTSLWVASKAGCELTAEDPLLLLGLAGLFSVRGKEWRPSDTEVEQFLALSAGKNDC
jgi:hypothetical protein